MATSIYVDSSSSENNSKFRLCLMKLTEASNAKPFETPT